MICKYYLPLVETSRGEINDACVNEEARTIKHCCYSQDPEHCPEFSENEPIHKNEQ